MAVILIGLLFVLVILWKPNHSIVSLRNKHVLITGGSSGIGLHIAKEALLQDAFVTVIARNPVKLEIAAEDLTKQANCNRTRINAKVIILYTIIDFKNISYSHLCINLFRILAFM